MRLPARSWPLWLAGVALWFGAVPVLLYDGTLYYAEGGQSPDGPGMAAYFAAVMSVIFLPALLMAQWAFLFRYRGGILTAWSGRTAVAEVLSVLAITLSIFALVMLFAYVDFWKPSRLPFVAYWLLWAGYMQVLRVAAVGRAAAMAGSISA